MTEQTTPITGTETKVPGAHWLALANETADPLECIAMALTGLLDIQVSQAEVVAEDGVVLELQAELEERQAAIGRVVETVGKSTATWADKIRAAVAGDSETVEGQANDA